MDLSITACQSTFHLYCIKIQTRLRCLHCKFAYVYLSPYQIMPSKNIVLILFLNTFWHCLVDGQATCREYIDKMITTKDGIDYWSSDLETEFKRNYGKISGLFRMDLDNLSLKDLRIGCGRMENRLGILSDGSEVCFRYRINLEQIQGEIYSYHLGKLLGIRNVLESKLILINESNSFWRRINIRENYWENMKFITATKFVRETMPVHLPYVVVQRNFKIDSNTSFCGLNNETNLEMIKFLFQWSDLVIFDYLIGNFDRVVSNMFNLQWHSNSLIDPIDNLIQMQGILLFIDNEEGLSHGYRLLDQYEQFNLKLIKNMCVFRRETLEKLETLGKLSALKLHEQLWYSIVESMSNPQILDYFTKISQHNINILKKRIDSVHKFVRGCRKRRGVYNL